jgi:hypothetical protein
MADVIVHVLTPAPTTALITLAELKLSLGLPSGAAASDAQLQQAIDWNSSSLAVRCNRGPPCGFAYERVEETWRYDGCECLQNPRIYLTHYPVVPTDIESVTTGGTLVDPANYEIEELTGKLRYLLGGWLDPTVITYSGGYVLPDAAPQPLKQAATLLTRVAYYAAQAASVTLGGVKMLGHKHARVAFFDPAVQLQMAEGGPAMQAAVTSLISHYTRYSI